MTMLHQSKPRVPAGHGHRPVVTPKRGCRELGLGGSLSAIVERDQSPRANNANSWLGPLVIGLSKPYQNLSYHIHAEQ